MSNKEVEQALRILERHGMLPGIVTLSDGAEDIIVHLKDILTISFTSWDNDLRFFNVQLVGGETMQRLFLKAKESGIDSEGRLRLIEMWQRAKLAK